eukprot:TRINITY_DN3632_c0_g1_i1.p1 TRINITY_DN3632_c0_g1~~TRINITY_DN3632_c0_g1_i1.p1  ORF type:complete len:512 (+),score=141.04 TRINITY_DN3632_c0_g1_i1:58-1593(+)
MSITVSPRPHSRRVAGSVPPLEPVETFISVASTLEPSMYDAADATGSSVYTSAQSNLSLSPSAASGTLVSLSRVPTEIDPSDILVEPVATRLFGRRLLDRSINRCTLCRSNFCILRRRHYCRKCGGIICGSCGTKKQSLWTGGEAVRVCDSCAKPKILELEKAGLMRNVLSFLDVPDMAAAFGASRSLHRPKNLPWAFETIKSIHDEYGPEMRYLERGSFASVHATTHKASGRQVAIKSISKSGIRTIPEFLRVVREVELHRSSEHPNVVRIERVCQTEHHVYVVMELASGDLFNWLSKNRASESDALLLAEQLLSALSFLHEERRVVHRDLKLENVLIFPQEGSSVPTLKLCDFGFARSVSAFHDVREGAGKPASTVPITPCGTALYFPPEILRGVAKMRKGAKLVDVDRSQLPKLDSFSAGVVLHFLLRRREPFKGGAPIQAARNIAAGVRWPEADSKEFGAGLATETKALVEGLLRNDPRERLTASAALAKLRQAKQVVPPASASSES